MTNPTPKTPRVPRTLKTTDERLSMRYDVAEDRFVITEVATGLVAWWHYPETDEQRRRLLVGGMSMDEAAEYIAACQSEGDGQ